MSLYKTLTLHAGSTFCETLDLIDNNGTPVNFFNYEIKARMAESGYSEDFIIINTEVINYLQGKIQISLSASETSLLSPGRYLFEIVIIDQNSVVTNLIHGIIDVIPGIGLQTSTYV